MREMCKDCLHFEHCINIPNYPVTNNTIGCDDWQNKDKYVPVVRCKDCVHYCGFEHCENGICDVGYVKRAVRPNDFCSLGERRNDNETKAT